MLSALWIFALTNSESLLIRGIGRKWFDCAECHQEQQDHQLLQKFDMVLEHEPTTFLRTLMDYCRPSLARNARSAFEKTPKNSKTGVYMERQVSPPRPPISRLGSDEYCPHCDNHFVIDAKTPTPALNLEGEDARVDPRMLKDDRMQREQQRSIFDVKDAPDRLG